MKKIIFMGTPDFAAYILEQLISTKEYEILMVVTQPDRPFGRKQQLKFSEVKEVAIKHGIEVFQPEKITNDFMPIVELAPDLIITAAYGQFVPQEVLDAPKIMCINVHGSLLPKYRGGAPIHYAVINGETQTGVTIMQMIKRMDAGDMISQKSISIGENDTTEIVYNNLKKIGAELLLETLPTMFDGTYKLIPQDEDMVTFSPNIPKEMELIEFDKEARMVHNHIRGLVSFPVGYAMFDEVRIKLFNSEITNIKATEPNTIYKFDKTGLYINCRDVVIKITEIQVAGKKKMSLSDYINGNLLLNEKTIINNKIEVK